MRNMPVNLDDLLIICGALLLRCLLISHPHSGQGQPPMFGDYEAQRHWQEVTVNLPIQEWYRNSSQNDLLYWGLDYPPLTAYHSYLLGKVFGYLNPDHIALGYSRGTETPDHRLKMRYSVLIADTCIFIPASLYFARSVFPASSQGASLTLAFITLYPGLILIDNGHFQYNNISLGLLIYAIAFLIRNRDLLGSIAFVCALNYKQMELYHALPFFFYLLGKCFKSKKPLIKLITIGGVVISMFIVIWWPFIQAGPDSVMQVVHRIFPIARGVFEDKVANFWCSLNIVYKLKKHLEAPQLVIMCLVSTLVAALPSNLAVLRNPSASNFLLCLINTSLAFFLFSYQVHEKSILLVAIPVALYGALVKEDFSKSIVTLMSTWCLIVSTLSMFPLLYKDGLTIPTISLTLFFIVGCLHTGFLGSSSASSVTPSKSSRRVYPIPKPSRVRWIEIAFASSVLGYVLLISAFLTVKPPSKWPDLWPVLICLFSCLHFIVFYLFFNYELFLNIYEENVSTKKKVH